MRQTSKGRTIRKVLAIGLFLIAAILSSPGYATSGPVTVVVTGASCMYFELNSTEPYYTLRVSDGNYDLSASLVLTSYLSGLRLTLGATSGTACGNTHMPRLSISALRTDSTAYKGNDVSATQLAVFYATGGMILRRKVIPGDDAQLALHQPGPGESIS